MSEYDPSKIIETVHDPRRPDVQVLRLTPDGHALLEALAKGEAEWFPMARHLLSMALAELNYHRAVNELVAGWVQEWNVDNTEAGAALRRRLDDLIEVINVNTNIGLFEEEGPD